MKKEPLSVMTVKTLLAVIIFTGMGTIVIGGAWLIGKQGEISKPAKPSQEQPAEIIKEEIKDEITDWQTYRNGEYGFEFKYPEGWILVKNDRMPFNMTIRREDISNKNLTKDDIQMVVGIYNFSSRGTIEDNLNYLRENLETDFFNSLEKISVNGGKGFYWIDESPAGPTLNVYLIGDNQVFLMGYNIYEDSSKNISLQTKLLFNQILSTFKFINQANTPDWQTYRNEEFGFEFKYSEDCFLYEPFDGRIYLKSETSSYLFGRIINISIGEKIAIEGKYSFSDASKMSFEEFISKRIRAGCAASRAGGGDSRERYCVGETEIKPFLGAEGIIGYEIYITEVTEITTVEGMTTEKRKKGPIFVFNISDQTYNRGLFFELVNETEKNLEKETHSKILNQVLSTFKVIERSEKIKIIYPTENTVWETGKTYQIQWRPSDSNDKVVIKLYKTPIASLNLKWEPSYPISNTGKYSFTVPAGIETGKYQLIIKGEQSDEFSIVSK